MSSQILTPNQEKTYDELTKLVNSFPALVIYGDAETGKDIIAHKLFSSCPKRDVITIDLCQLSLQGKGSLSPDKFYQHFVNAIYLDKPAWIYIRHWDKFREIVEDYNVNYRYFLKYSLVRFFELLSVGKKQIIITTEKDPKIESSKCWIVKHNLNIDDFIVVLKSRLPNLNIDEVIPLMTNIKMRYLNQIITYVLSFPQEEHISKFKEGIIKVCGSPLNPDEKVIETVPKINLIGMKDIIEAIEIAIISPIEFGSDLIPLKKGIVLTGPPGTGKTSIGRWLAYRLRGKLYLVDGSVGVNGNNLIVAITDALNRAHQNGPAVVFIDDVDLLFHHDDTYRSFLTLLDGLENKQRSNVCVVVTCMDISSIPSSLIRGGRLELCLETRLPDEKTREEILNYGFTSMIKLLSRFEQEKKINLVTTQLEDEITSKFLRSLIGKMSGWNCADIRRFLDDVLRIILSYRHNSLPSLREISESVISAIRRQYELVLRPEDRADISFIYN